MTMAFISDHTIKGLRQTLTVPKNGVLNRFHCGTEPPPLAQVVRFTWGQSKGLRLNPDGTKKWEFETGGS